MTCKRCKKEIPEGSKFCNFCGRKQEAAKRRTHKRASGQGTVRKDPRYASCWLAYAPAGGSGQGRRYLGAFKTVGEANEAINKYLQQGRPDIYTFTVAQTFEAWSKVHFPTLTKSGVQGYQAAYKSIEKIYGLKMRDIKTAHIQTCIDECSEAGFSRSKCEKIRQLCSQLCKYAMQNDLIDKNYAEFVKMPKSEKKNKAVFTNDDLNVLWSHTDDKRVQVILFMIYTGFRIGEVAAIRVQDVHLDEGYIIGGEKTEAGIDRIVPLPAGVPEIGGFVRDWLAQAESDKLFDFTAEYFRKYEFYPCLAELGLIEPPERSALSGKALYKNPRLTPHCTRHTFATMSAAAGIKPEQLQKIIGHANFETTANIYVHSDIDILKKEMAKITHNFTHNGKEF